MRPVWSIIILTFVVVVGVAQADKSVEAEIKEPTSAESESESEEVDVSKLPKEHRGLDLDQDAFGIELDDLTPPKPPPPTPKGPALKHRPPPPPPGPPLFRKPLHPRPPQKKRRPSKKPLRLPVKKPFLRPKPQRKQPRKIPDNRPPPPIRRDGGSSYGAPRRPPSYGAPAEPQVIIKQAGPSQHFGWVGHGRHAPLNIPNPFPSNLPKWVPMGNNVFEVNLLYPGKPGSSASPGVSYKAPAPAPAPVVSSSSGSYSAPAPVVSSSSSGSYSAPAPVAPASSSSYSAPVASSGPSFTASAPVVSSAGSSYSSPSSSFASPSSSSFVSSSASNSYSSPSVPSTSTSYTSVASASSSYSIGSPASAPAPAPASSAGSSYSTVGSSAPVQSSFGSFAASSSPSSSSSSFFNSAPASAPASNSYNVGSAPASNSYNVGSAPASNSYNVASAPASNSYNVASAPASNSYNVASAPAAPTSIFSPAQSQPSVIQEQLPGSAEPADTPSYVAAAHGDTSEYERQPVQVWDPSTQTFVESTPLQSISAEEQALGQQDSGPTYTREVGSVSKYQTGFSPSSAPPKGKANVFEVPIEVQETFDPFGLLQNQAEQGPAQAPASGSAPGEDPEVFYIFYESEDEAAEAASQAKGQGQEDYYQTAQDASVGYVVEEPADSKFTPPDEDDIRTIYVPLENAVNVPDSYTLSLGTSFGYSNKKKNKNKSRTRPKQPEYDDGRDQSGSSSSGFPNFPLATRTPPTYGDPISSYDAPIYNDNSYTAAVESDDPEPTSSHKQRGRRTRVRKVRRPAAPVEEPDLIGEDSTLFYAAPSLASVPYGTRIKRRKPYNPVDDEN